MFLSSSILYFILFNSLTLTLNLRFPPSLSLPLLFSYFIIYPSNILLPFPSLLPPTGATYTATLDRGLTSVLIVSSPEGKKYNFAVKWGIPCVYPDWLYQSVQQGHALEMEEYEVLSRKTSTLTNSQLYNGKCLWKRKKSVSNTIENVL